MQNLRILIVEDDLIIAESLKMILEGMDYEVAATCRSGNEVLEIFRPGFADIIIMDIHLKGEMNGIETSQEIRKFSTAPIIYVTDNRDEYLRKKAIFETNTVNYLSKPFTRFDISVAIDLAIKAIKNHDLKLKQANDSSFLVDDSIFIKDAQSFRKILISDILFLRADRSYCHLIYRIDDKNGSESILFSENLSFLEEKLAFAKALVRVHRSFIINIHAVKKIQENRLWVESHEVPIGKTYRNEIRDRFRFI